jgi:hypothetical protein
MEQKYEGLDKIPDEAIVEQFAKATEVNFSARPRNNIWRSIAFGDLGWWLPLSRVLPLVGVTQQMLRTVFNPQHEMVKRHFPFNLGWFGLNKNCYKTIKVELPAVIVTYDQLGYFPLDTQHFLELARVLGKSVKVMREDGGTGDHYFLFIAHPYG